MFPALHPCLSFHRHFCFFLNWCLIALQCCVRFRSLTTRISCMCTHMPPLWSLPGPCPYTHPLDDRTAPNWAPGAMRELPTGYLFYTWKCVHVGVTLLIHPSYSLPYCAQKSILLCLHLSSCPANRFISTIFLDGCILDRLFWWQGRCARAKLG